MRFFIFNKLIGIRVGIKKMYLINSIYNHLIFNL